MARLIGPGNFGQIDVPVPRDGTSVSNLRESFDIPPRYSFTGRDRDGSVKELGDGDTVWNDEIINLIPEHEHG